MLEVHRHMAPSCDDLKTSAALGCDGLDVALTRQACVQHRLERQPSARVAPAVGSAFQPAYTGESRRAVMFERFTQLARQALFCARFKAEERNGDAISGQD